MRGKVCIFWYNQRNLILYSKYCYNDVGPNLVASFGGIGVCMFVCEYLGCNCLFLPMVQFLLKPAIGRHLRCIHVYIYICKYM